MPRSKNDKTIPLLIQLGVMNGTINPDMARALGITGIPEMKQQPDPTKLLDMEIRQQDARISSEQAQQEMMRREIEQAMDVRQRQIDLQFNQMQKALDLQAQRESNALAAEQARRAAEQPASE